MGALEISHWNYLNIKSLFVRDVRRWISVDSWRVILTSLLTWASESLYEMIRSETGIKALS